MYAQSDLIIVPFDGNENNVELSTIDHIYFIEDNLTILRESELDSILTYALTSIRKLYFCETTITEVVEGNDSNFIIYPNPVSDFFTIDGINNECNVVICSMTGIEVLRKHFSKGDFVDVRTLRSGIYVVRIGDVAYKFIKK